MRIRWIIIVGLALVGAVWIGQGLGLIRGSGFMTDDVRWVMVGTVLVVISVVFGVIEGRRGSA